MADRETTDPNMASDSANEQAYEGSQAARNLTQTTQAVKEDESSQSEGLTSVLDSQSYTIIGQIAEAIKEALSDIADSDEAIEDLSRHHEGKNTDSTEAEAQARSTRGESGGGIDHSDYIDMSASGADAAEGIMESGANNNNAVSEDNTYENFSLDDSSANSEESALLDMNVNDLAEQIGAALEAQGAMEHQGDFQVVSDNSGNSGVNFAPIQLLFARAGWMDNPQDVFEAFQNLMQDIMENYMNDLSEIGHQGFEFSTLADMLSQETYSYEMDGETYSYTTTTYADGTVVYEDSSGYTSQSYMDADGNWIYEDSTGYTSITYPDGSMESQSADGSWYTYDAATGESASYDALTDTHIENGVVTLSDGSTMSESDYWAQEMDSTYTYDTTDTAYIDSGTYDYDDAGYYDDTSYAETDMGLYEYPEPYLNDDGMMQMDMTDGSYSYWSEDGSAGGYYDAPTGYSFDYYTDDDGNWVYETTDPSGMTYLDNGEGMVDANGNVVSYDDFYTAMDQAYAEAYDYDLYGYDDASMESYDTASMESTDMMDSTMDMSVSDYLDSASAEGGQSMMDDMSNMSMDYIDVASVDDMSDYSYDYQEVDYSNMSEPVLVDAQDASAQSDEKTDAVQDDAGMVVSADDVSAAEESSANVNNGPVDQI